MLGRAGSLHPEGRGFESILTFALLEERKFDKARSFSWTFTGQLPGGEELRLCRLRYAGYARSWGFAIYRASHRDCHDS